MDQAAVLAQVAEQVANCQACTLFHSRKRSVPGEGPFDAEIMMIGEGPGFYENEQGRPFVGQAGKLLEELLASFGYRREQVFITNVVKCRPPGNRDPQPDELAACGGYLDRQISTLQPMIIVTLGRFSMAKFLPNVRISDVHGQARWVGTQLVVPMYHPAAALHQPALRPQLVKDFLLLPEYIELARSKRAPVKPAVHMVAEERPDKAEQPKTPPDDPTQLSLF